MVIPNDPRKFLYRDGALDPDEAKRLATRHLAHCDDGELYLQYSASEAFGFDDGRLKTADYSTVAGFGLRGVAGETTAFAHANEISAAAIERAAGTLELLEPAKGRPASAPSRTNQTMYVADDPLIPCRNSTFGPSAGPSTATSNPTPSLSMRMPAILPLRRF